MIYSIWAFSGIRVPMHMWMVAVVTMGGKWSNGVRAQQHCYIFEEHTAESSVGNSERERLRNSMNSFIASLAWFKITQNFQYFFVKLFPNYYFSLLKMWLVMVAYQYPRLNLQTMPVSRSNFRFQFHKFPFNKCISYRIAWKPIFDWRSVNFNHHSYTWKIFIYMFRTQSMCQCPSPPPPLSTYLPPSATT